MINGDLFSHIDTKHDLTGPRDAGNHVSLFDINMDQTLVFSYERGRNTTHLYGNCQC